MNLIRNDLLYDGRRGEAISLLLTNEIPREEEKVYFDDVEMDAGTVQRAGWYMGKPLYLFGEIDKTGDKYP